MKFSILLECALVAAATTSAQTYTGLKDFSPLGEFNFNSDGARPYAGVVVNGNTLYGMTYQGGSLGFGTVFKLNTDGNGFTVLRHFASFASSDGANPRASLVVNGSTLFGTTSSGGVTGLGTVFKMNTDGSGFTVLKSFLAVAYNDSGFYTNSEGCCPHAGLALNGSVLFGTASGGGSSGYGTIFKLNTDGTGYTVLKHFTASDGAFPEAPLLLDGSTLYGTTMAGGTSSGLGTVFKVNIDGSGYTVLKDFTFGNRYDGANPYGGLVLNGSTLFGTTCYGGNFYNGTVFKVNTDGSGYTVLRYFSENVANINSDGANPSAGLMLNGSTLYGTTFFGGNSGHGTVFKIKMDGRGYRVLEHFTLGDGENPKAALVLNGTFLYGTTFGGGSAYNGTVFKLDLSTLLDMELAGNKLVLSWINPNFLLQSAPAVTGPFSTISGAASPYTNSFTGSQQYFRLIGN